jgi:D-glycero-D-manno-heptose 1,7-bisphosphate phosphatase
MSIILPGEEAYDALCGMWTWVSAPVDGPRRPALFLDRDGVLVEEVNYLKRVEDVRLVPGAAEVVHRANRQGLPVVVVTNQGGIGLGYFDWATLVAVQAQMQIQLAEQGAHLDAVLACPYHEEASEPYRHDSHPARKPSPGMLLKAAELLPIDLTQSWIVGDRTTDLVAGRNGGLPGGILVRTGHGPKEVPRFNAVDWSGFQASIADSIVEAAAAIPILGD